MPANYSPSFAKNIIRRSLSTILDPHPTKSQLRLLRDHFGSDCAYCGKRIHAQAKDAQLDHIDPDGPNNLSNRLYACEDCNEKEKRDSNWQEFLRLKADSDEAMKARETLIHSWIEKHDGSYMAPNKARQEELRRQIDKAVTAFDESLEAIRALRQE